MNDLRMVLIRRLNKCQPLEGGYMAITENLIHEVIAELSIMQDEFQGGFDQGYRAGIKAGIVKLLKRSIEAEKQELPKIEYREVDYHAAERMFDRPNRRN